jgi:hypothetical protein
MAAREVANGHAGESLSVLIIIKISTMMILIEKQCHFFRRCVHSRKTTKGEGKKDTWLNFYKVVAVPAQLYACEAWTPIKIIVYEYKG